MRDTVLPASSAPLLEWAVAVVKLASSVVIVGRAIIAFSASLRIWSRVWGGSARHKGAAPPPVTTAVGSAESSPILVVPMPPILVSPVNMPIEASSASGSAPMGLELRSPRGLAPSPRQESLPSVSASVVPLSACGDRAAEGASGRGGASSVDAGVAREQCEADVWRRGYGVSRERLWWRSWRGVRPVRGSHR